MLAGVEELGLVGVAVLPGPMVKLPGKSHPYVTLDDFAGDVVGLQASVLHDQALTILGSTTKPMAAAAVGIGPLDGYAQQLGSIWGNHYELQADYVTANLNLWPRPLVIVANADTFESLDAQQRAALDSASAAAVAVALEHSADEDAGAGHSLCEAGMAFPVASDDDLAELRAALDPVYTELAGDPETSDYLDAIVALKDEVAAPPHTVDCARPAPVDSIEGAELGGPPDGTYAMTLTADDLRNCPDWEGSEEATHDENLFELVLDGGHLEIWVTLGEPGGHREIGTTGTISFFRDAATITEGGETLSARWEFDGTQLAFSDLEGPRECTPVTVWTAHPWVLIEPEG